MTDAFLAEQPGFQHVHVHVVARPPKDDRGVNAFSLLQHPQTEWVPTAEMDALAERIRQRLEPANK